MLLYKFITLNITGKNYTIILSLFDVNTILSLSEGIGLQLFHLVSIDVCDLLLCLVVIIPLIRKLFLIYF